jgi:signal peptidase I
MKALKTLFCGKTWRGSLVRILSLLTICTVPFWYHYRILYVDGISMTPTYDDGQWTLMQRIRSFDQGWVPDRFDAIVVWDKNRKVKLCKRVIGLPGEKIEVIEGRIFIDDKLLSDSFGKGYMVVEHLIDPDTKETWWKKYENTPSTIIAPNHVWVVGDNREDSVFGHFPIKEICGKIVLY